MSIAVFLRIFILSMLIGMAPLARADESDPFYPTWKLLSPEAKEQFIAGYMQGWRDAEIVTDVVTQYVKENPQKALDGLERIRSLYDMSAFKPTAVVLAIDKFYTDPTNTGSGLSKAVSAARQMLSR